MTPKPAAKRTEPEGMAAEPPPPAESSEGPVPRPETNDTRADNMANEGPVMEPPTAEAQAPEAAAKPAPEPPQHCPVCGQEMEVEAGYWVCSDQKCGTRLPHEFHPAEELAHPT